MESDSNQLRSFHLNLKCNSCEIFVVFCCVQCLTITNVPIFSAILAAYILLDDKDKHKSTIHCCYRILLYGRSMLTRSFKIWTTHFEMYFLARLALTGQFCARGILEFQKSHYTHFFIAAVHHTTTYARHCVQKLGKRSL